jgi:hypothetical protein
MEAAETPMTSREAEESQQPHPSREVTAYGSASNAAGLMTTGLCSRGFGSVIASLSMRRQRHAFAWPRMHAEFISPHNSSVSGHKSFLPV